MSDNLNITVTASLDKQKSISQINSDIKKIEGQLKKLKLQVSLDKNKSSAEVNKQIETLSKQRKKLYIDLKIRKNSLKKEFEEIQKQANTTLNVNTDNAQKQINNVRNTIRSTNNDSVTLASTLKNALSNAGYTISAQTALQAVRKAAAEATEAVKLYDSYVTNLSVITGGSRESSNQLLGNLAEKSLKFKVDVSDLESAEETILRTGKSIDETNKYLENTVYLSKLGFQGMDDSATQLITIGNAYGYTADEMAAVVDKFVKLDSTANVTAGKLAEGVAKSAANSKLAGFNIDELAASIAGLKEVTGRTESEISNSLNMIFARLQNVKLGKFILETEDGDTEEITQQINDMEKLLDTFGIKLRNSKNEFRDINKLFTEISDNWSKFNNVQKSAIATTAAGARQRNTFIALIENWNKIQGLVDTSLNSMGTAAQKYENYLQSIEAKSAVLETSVKQLWNNLLPSDFIGDMTDAGTAIVQFTDKYQVLQTMLKSAVFYSLTKGLILAKDGFTGMVTSIKNVSAAMNLASKGTALTSAEFTTLKGITKSLSDSQLKLILSNSNLTNAQKMQLVSTEGLTQAEVQQKYAALGITQANQQAATATFSLSGAFKTLWSVLLANPVVSLTMAFTAVSTIITTVKQKQEELRQTISDTAQTAKEQTDKLNDLISSYEEFANKVTYTSEEKAKLKSIQEQLVEAYHTEVDGIDLVNGKYDEQIKRLQQLKKEKLEEAELSLIAEREQAHKDASYGNLPNKSFNISADWFKSDDDYKKIAEELNKRVSGFTTDIAWASKAFGIDSQIHLFAGDVNYRVEQIKEAMEVLKEYGYTSLGLYSNLSELLAEYQKLADEENTAISNLAENKFQQYQINNPYDEKAGKDAYLSWKQGLIDSAEGDTALQQELTNLAEKQFPDYQKYFDNIAELKSKYVDTTADISNAISKMDFIKSLSIEDSEIATQIPDLFKNGLDGASKAITEWKNNPANKIETDIDTDNIEDFSKVIETASKKQSALKSAMEDMADTGYLSSDTYADLIKLGGNFTKCLELQNGKLTLNAEKLKALEKQEYLNTISANKLSIAELQLAAVSLKGVGTEWITEKITALEEQNALYETLIDEIQKVKPDDKKKSSKTEKPQSVLDFEKELARRQHKIKVGEMKEDEDYYNWLEKAYRKAYDGVKDCQDDIYKYEEMVYDGRKKLAEDLYKEQQKAFENRVSDLEAQITVTEKHNVDSDGNSLDAASKFDYIRAIYNDLITETENRINEIIQAGIEGHEDEVKELEKQIEEYRDKLQDTFKDEIEYEIDYLSTLEKKYEDFIDKRIKQYEKEKDAVKDRYDSEIKSLDKTIDALKDKNDETKNAIDLKKAEQDLEKSRQRTRMTYGSDGTITYKQDNEAIAEAQQKVNDIKIDMIVNNLEKQKQTLEEQKDIEVDKYDDMITVLEEQKDTQEKYFETLIEILSNYLNPKATENIQSVWDRIFSDKTNIVVKDTNVNVKGTDIDTSSAVFGEVDSDKINQTLNKADEASQKFKETGDFIDNFMKDLYAKSGKTPDAYERYKRGEFGNVLDSLTSSFSYNNMIQKGVGDITRNITTNKVINNSQPTTFNFGDINVNNPVGDVKQLAKEVKNELHKEAMMQIPNDAMRIIYKQ